MDLEAGLEMGEKRGKKIFDQEKKGDANEVKGKMVLEISVGEYFLQAVLLNFGGHEVGGGQQHDEKGDEG
jgi:hypothetical protein